MSGTPLDRPAGSPNGDLLLGMTTSSAEEVRCCDPSLTLFRFLLKRILWDKTTEGRECSAGIAGKLFVGLLSFGVL